MVYLALNPDSRRVKRPRTQKKPAIARYLPGTHVAPQLADHRDLRPGWQLPQRQLQTACPAKARIPRPTVSSKFIVIRSGFCEKTAHICYKDQHAQLLHEGLMIIHHHT